VRAVRGRLAQIDGGRWVAPIRGVAVTIEGVFSACNMIATVGWLVLLFSPRSRRGLTLAGTVIPLFLAVIYLAVFVLNARGSRGGFSSLAGVAQLFDNHWLLLAGWVHYLAFDLFIGAWETRDAMARGLSRLWLAPCLFMTFMLGPIGLLAYHLARTRAHQPLDVPVFAPMSKAH
jgi:hypothetical protein